MFESLASCFAFRCSASLNMTIPRYLRNAICLECGDPATAAPLSKRGHVRALQRIAALSWRHFEAKALVAMH
jgi:hypothetical protein